MHRIKRLSNLNAFSDEESDGAMSSPFSDNSSNISTISNSPRSEQKPMALPVKRLQSQIAKDARASKSSTPRHQSKRLESPYTRYSDSDYYEEESSYEISPKKSGQKRQGIVTTEVSNNIYEHFERTRSTQEGCSQESTHGHQQNAIVGHASAVQQPQLTKRVEQLENELKSKDELLKAELQEKNQALKLLETVKAQVNRKRTDQYYSATNCN
jgi:hypothetical protein